MVVQFVPSATMTFQTYTEAVQVLHIYVLGVLGSFVDVFNWPARSALVPRLVPPGLMMNAVTINAMIIQLSFLLGPAVGGVLIDHTGLAATYLISTIALIPAIIAIIAIRTSGKPQGARRRVSIRSMVEGVEFIWIQRIILSLFLLDFGVTLSGSIDPSCRSSQRMFLTWELLDWVCSTPPLLRALSWDRLRCLWRGTSNAKVSP